MAQERLLDRDAFREGVFARDRHRCVLCGAPGRDAHHVLERRLFVAEGERGGYFVGNGVTVCAPCHLACEATDVSVEAVREAAGIVSPPIPRQLDPALPYSKWGDVVLPDGMRLRGPLFREPSVRKALGGNVRLYDHRMAFPRGVAGSEAARPGSVALAVPAGAAAAIHPEGPQRGDGSRPGAGLALLWERIGPELPPGWWVRGVEAATGFVGFEVWDDGDACLPWSETAEYLALLDVPAAQVTEPERGALVRPPGAIDLASYPWTVWFEEASGGP